MPEQRMIELAQWRLRDVDVGAGTRVRVFDEPLDAAPWIAIAAPGDIYLALHAAGRLPEPFGDRAEPACAWVKDREWWQCTDFDAPSIGPDERLVLDLEGLDTFAAVWLNGELLAETDNMFRRWRFDVTTRLRPGRNRLAIGFTPTATRLAGKEMPVWPIISDPIVESKRNFVRKAQFGWGWDFGPRLPSVGIWKPATLRLQQQAVLRDVKFTTTEIAPDRSHAHVVVDVSAERFSDGEPLQAEVSLHAPDGTELERRRVTLEAGRATVEWRIARPALWWTPELGAPDLHHLEVTLRAGDVSVDRRQLRVGVRTIALDQSPDPDEPGARFFRFVLNGVPIFARGANWTPASSFVGALDAARYRHLLDMAAAANMNMVRVWGGGLYEHEAFYDRCDELGLLVWQDFMFACSPYPEHEPEFVANVRAEVDEQITRLRHHACIALWCGANETHAVQGFMNRMLQRDDPLLGALYFDDVMPAAVARLDPTTPYWPSSPFGGPNKQMHNSMLEGDVHNWTVWHGLPPTPVDEPIGDFDHSPAGVAYTRYAEDMCRFVGEFGIQAAPGMATLARVLPPDQRALGSPGLLNRIKDKPLDKVDAMLIPVTGLPQTLEDYVAFTQITQAEGLKFGIEHYRRRKPHCSGALLWQFNDCWPGVSWSIVDHYGLAKAAYDYVRRAYAPVMASFKAVEGGVELWIVNDTPRPVQGRSKLALMAFSGAVDWSLALELDVLANASRCVWRGEGGDSAAKLLTVRSDSDLFPPNRLFFAAIKDLDRPEPQAPQCIVTQGAANELTVRITASTWLYLVHLQVPTDFARFSDNHFELLPGETREIVVRADTPLDAQGLTLAWR